MDEKHCCRRGADRTPPSRPPSARRSRNERLECKLRRLNVTYRWDRIVQLELLPPPLTPSSTTDATSTSLLANPAAGPPPTPSSTTDATSTSLLANPAAAAALGRVTKRSGR
ncbi:unnamed protein product, partial [Laminaria digitata]